MGGGGGGKREGEGQGRKREGEGEEGVGRAQSVVAVLHNAALQVRPSSKGIFPLD